MHAEFLLGLLNGVWAICSLSLMIICAAYLKHETIARAGSWPSLHWRKRMTRGMRVATAVLGLSLGVFIRSSTVYVWRMESGDLPDLSQPLLLIGAVIAVVGFLFTIREMAGPLFGHKPWLYTLGAVVAFLAINIAIHAI